MKRNSSFLLILAFLSLSGCGSNDDKKSGGSPANAAKIQGEQCANTIDFKEGGTTISPDKIPFKKGSTWKLQSLETYQEISSKDAAKIGFAGYTVSQIQKEPVVKQNCKGMNFQGTIDFTSKVASAFSGLERNILGNLETKAHGDHESDMSFESSESSQADGIFLDPTKSTPAERIEVRLISNDKIQVLAITQTENSEAVIRFRFLSTYTMVEKTRMELHAEAYSFATKHSYYGGIGADRDWALKFADSVSDLDIARGTAYLEDFKTSFAWARKPSYHGGLGAEPSFAVKFADAVADSADAKKLLAQFQEIYLYARKTTYYGGLGMETNDAFNYAAKKTGLKI